MAMIGGFAAGLVATAAATLAVAGPTLYAAWFNTLTWYAGVPNVVPHMIDLAHFLQRLRVPQPRLVFAALALPAAALLLWKWRTYEHAKQEGKRLRWALALSATLVLSL